MCENSKRLAIEQKILKHAYSGTNIYFPVKLKSLKMLKIQDHTFPHSDVFFV